MAVSSAQRRLQELGLPTHREVCPRCDGRGTHVNPSIDGNGLSRDDIDELGGQDFLDDYLGGVYDVRCEECDGRNVVDVVDEDRLTEDQRDALDELREYEQELAWERRMRERGMEW